VKSVSEPQKAVSSHHLYQPVLGIDIDEVLAPFIGEFFNWHNARFGTSLKLHDDFVFYDAKAAQKEAGDTKEQLLEKWHDFTHTHWRELARPTANAHNTLLKLQHHYCLIAITGRPANARVVTESWLTTHFPELFHQVHFVGVQESGRPNSKQATMRELGIKILIDDNIQHIREAAAEGIHGILFGDYPWSRKAELPTGAARATSWKEVENLLL
jgi:5'(3')-deoxyribonucleotidase